MSTFRRQRRQVKVHESVIVVVINPQMIIASSSHRGRFAPNTGPYGVSKLQLSNHRHSRMSAGARVGFLIACASFMLILLQFGKHSFEMVLLITYLFCFVYSYKSLL